jgi:MFS family permease
MVTVTAGTRWASRAQFFSSGFIFATWGVHVPTVKAHYGIDEAQLGLAMLAAGAGAMIGLTSAGRWIGRHGPRRMAGLCGCLYALLLAGLIAMPGYGALLVLLAAFGLVTSVFDVSINTEAAQLELQGGTPLMSGMHGMFSLGGMAGAASGSAALAAGLGAQTHLLIVAAAMVLLVAVAATRMLPRPAASGTGDADHGFLLPRGTLAVLGVLAALGLIAGRRDLRLERALHAAGNRQPAAAGRARLRQLLRGDGGGAFRRRRDACALAPATLLLGSGLLAAAAMTLVLITDLPWLALVGFAGVGVGFANVVPILFSASANVPAWSPRAASRRCRPWPIWASWQARR